jgi:hypothetical protein
MTVEIGKIFGNGATDIIHQRFTNFNQIDDNPEMFWKLQVAKLAESQRCNIPSDHGIDLYVYDHLLPGIDSWKDYYLFLVKMSSIF